MITWSRGTLHHQHHHHHVSLLTPESFFSLNKRASRPGKAQRHHEVWYISSIHSAHASHPAAEVAAGRAPVSRHTELKGCQECGIISLPVLSHISYKNALYNCILAAVFSNESPSVFNWQNRIWKASTHMYYVYMSPKIYVCIINI